VSNKLLARAEIILFLNKYDILRQKLNLGIRFSKFVTSYRERNTAENVGRCMHYISLPFRLSHMLVCRSSKEVYRNTCPTVPQTVPDTPIVLDLCNSTFLSLIFIVDNVQCSMVISSLQDKSSTAILIAQCRELVLQQHFQHMSLI